MTHPNPGNAASESEMLLPCPFCGATDMWVGFDGDEDGGYGYVECRASCAQAHEDTTEEAIAAWNTRVPTPPSGEEAQ